MIILRHEIHFKHAPKCIQEMFKTNREFKEYGLSHNQHLRSTFNNNNQHLRSQHSKHEYIHTIFS